MFNFKKILLITVFLLIIIFPIGSAFAESISPLWFSPTTIPLAATLELPKLFGIDVTGSVLGASNDFIVDAIMKAFSLIVYTLSTLLLGIGQAALDFVMKSPIIWMSPTDFVSTSPNYNSIVATGWGIVRNVANAALVIGLVIIAINIILGREENKAKKTLVNFIIIALLINFTPIICGFIIDGSNILTKSFVVGGIDGNLANQLMDEFDKALSGAQKSSQTIIVSIVLFLFAIVCSFIYLLYALLFLARSLILWILVIVSPIAFATKVFPQSKYIKKIFPSILYWDDWWESFLQWCVIGIPAGMSIYLANMIIPGIVINIDIKDISSIIDSLILMVFESLTPFIILIAGFFISISAGGQVGSTIGGLASSAWGRTGGRAISRIKETAVAGGEWMVEGGKRTVAGATVGGLSGALQGAEDARGKGLISELKGLTVGGMKGTVGGMGVEGREKAAKKIAEVKEGIGWAKRGEYSGELSGKVEEAQKRMSNISKEDREKISLSPAMTKGGEIERAGAFKKSLEKGELSVPQLDYLSKNTKWAETFGVNLKDVAKARPDYAQKLVNKSSSDIIGGMSPSEVGKIINSSAYLDPETLSSIAASNMKAIDGKLSKGSGKDIENIKKGYVNLIKQHLPAATIDANDLKSFVDDKINQTAITNVIKGLESSLKKDDKVMARGIKNLSNAALDDKFNI
ncbi:MAG: hypothetical protein WC511_05700 [Candidatus Pacearchaeota archaeon]